MFLIFQPSFTKDQTFLPHNANLGSIQPFTSNHEQVFSDAADHTAHTLADTWFEYVKHTGKAQTPLFVARSQAQPSSTSPPPPPPLGLGHYKLRHLRWQRLV